MSKVDFTQKHKRLLSKLVDQFERWLTVGVQVSAEYIDEDTKQTVDAVYREATEKELKIVVDYLGKFYKADEEGAVDLATEFEKRKNEAKVYENSLG